MAFDAVLAAYTTDEQLVRSAQQLTPAGGDINWGDGTSSGGTLVQRRAADGRYLVEFHAAHTYAQPGRRDDQRSGHGRDGRAGDVGRHGGHVRLHPRGAAHRAGPTPVAPPVRPCGDRNRADLPRVTPPRQPPGRRYNRARVAQVAKLADALP